MTDQKSEFLGGEGDRMFERYMSAGSNIDVNSICGSLREIGAKPEAVLEVGCSAGHQLELLRQEFGAQCYGVDPSASAIEYGRKHYPRLNLTRGTAESLDYDDEFFDVVIFGFCLYLCDLRDHFRIAWHADRVLRDRGYLAITDFFAPAPFSNGYAHVSGMRSHKMEWARMFTWNPAYRLVSRRYLEHQAVLSFAPDEQVCTDILHKNRTIAFPNNPFR